MCSKLQLHKSELSGNLKYRLKFSVTKTYILKNLKCHLNKNFTKKCHKNQLFTESEILSIYKYHWYLKVTQYDISLKMKKKNNGVI